MEVGIFFFEAGPGLAWGFTVLILSAKIQSVIVGIYYDSDLVVQFGSTRFLPHPSCVEF